MPSFKKQNLRKESKKGQERGESRKRKCTYEGGGRGGLLGRERVEKKVEMKKKRM